MLRSFGTQIILFETSTDSFMVANTYYADRCMHAYLTFARPSIFLDLFDLVTILTHQYRYK